jgi:hypothetical protein
MVETLAELSATIDQRGSAGHERELLERMQQPQGDHLTGPEMCVGVFGEGAHLLIDLVEQRGDKIYGGHVHFLSWHGFYTPYQLGGTA